MNENNSYMRPDNGCIPQNLDIALQLEFSLPRPTSVVPLLPCCHTTQTKAKCLCPHVLERSLIDKTQCIGSSVNVILKGSKNPLMMMMMMMTTMTTMMMMM